MPPVYAAKYSNVPVWVSTVKDVSVMRRQGDGWVNATHLLKVADFDKPRRTRILERDVQTGEHEKVQGGYGKYQGTWIPASRALELAQQVGILELVNDLIVYAPEEGVTTQELPRLPKPVTTRKNGEGAGAGGNGMPAKRARKLSSVPSAPSPSMTVPRAQHMQTMPPNINTSFPGMPQWAPFSPQTPYTPGQMPQHLPQQLPQQVGVPPMGMPGMPQMHMMPMPGFPMPMMSPYAPQATPRPTNHESQPASAASSPSLSSSALSSGSDGFSDDDRHFPSGSHFQSRHAESTAEPAVAAAAKAVSASAADHVGPGAAGPPHQDGLQQYMAEYSTNLLDFFMSSDKSVIPSLLLTPKAGPHINQPIDDEGNTVFHWTCAMGQIEIMRALINAGADIRAVNGEGHTPLVRAVMFTNNYEARTFPQVLEMLVETAGYVDNDGHTLLHHIATTASSRGRASGARYYTEILLAKLRTSTSILENGLAAFIDHQDVHGDTALHIASRHNAQRLSKVLLSYHARADISNKAGRVAKDMLRVKHAPLAAEPAAAAGPVPVIDEDTDMFASKSVQAAQHMSKAIGDYLSGLAKAYDVDVANKESDIEQVRQLLDRVRARVADAERQIPELEEELGPEDSVESEIERLEDEARKKSTELRRLIERSQARNLAIIVQKEETDIQDELREALSRKEPFDEASQVALALNLRDMQVKRRNLADEIVALYGNTGSREKIGKYRQLLATCLEVPEKDVDDLLDGIAETLETQGS